MLKKRRSEINNLNFDGKALEKEQTKSKPTASRREGIMKIRVELHREEKNNREKSMEPKTGSLKRSSKLTEH